MQPSHWTEWTGPYRLSLHQQCTRTLISLCVCLFVTSISYHCICIISSGCLSCLHCLLISDCMDVVFLVFSSFSAICHSPVSSLNWCSLSFVVPCFSLTCPSLSFWCSPIYSSRKRWDLDLSSSPYLVNPDQLSPCCSNQDHSLWSICSWISVSAVAVCGMLSGSSCDQWLWKCKIYSFNHLQYIKKIKCNVKINYIKHFTIILSNVIVSVPIVPHVIYGYRLHQMNSYLP